MQDAQIDSGEPAQRTICSNLKQLLCDSQTAPIFIRCVIIFTCTLNLLFQCMFLTSRMPGEKPIILLLLGTGLSSGVMVSSIGLKFLKDKHVYMIALFIVIIAQLLMNEGESKDKSKVLIYVLFLITLQAIGATLNIQFIIISTRISA